jgi:hypothetical protein
MKEACIKDVRWFNVRKIFKSKTRFCL